MGRIIHPASPGWTAAAATPSSGVRTRWVTAQNGTPLVDEDTTFTFRATADGLRVIDRATYLRAAGQDVTFTDNKEGMLGLRVRRALEDPAEKGGEFVDAAGKVTKIDGARLHGRDRRLYEQRGQDGRQGLGHARQVDHARRARSTDARSPSPSSTIRAIPGYPTYWHARGYGLFAANPLGQAVFSEGKEKLNFIAASAARTSCSATAC